MSETVIAALISAVVALLVSLVATFLQKRADLIKIQKEQEHGYAKALFDKRVEHYPELYNYLSGYSKTIRSHNQNLQNLSEFKHAVDEWNSRHSLFFTRATSQFSSKFRYFLGRVLDGKAQPSKEDWENIRQLNGYFERFLRAEIGIFAARPAGDITEVNEAFNLVNELIGKSDQK